MSKLLTNNQRSMLNIHRSIDLKNLIGIIEGWIEIFKLKNDYHNVIFYEGILDYLIYPYVDRRNYETKM